MIAPGIYNETINFGGKAITVTGSAPGVIVDGGQEGPVVTFNSKETRSAILQNLTVRNGMAISRSQAAGVLIVGASPTIQNVSIENNLGCGVGIYNGAPAILDSVISGNTFPSVASLGCFSPLINFGSVGGGVVAYGPSLDGLNIQLVSNTIENNQTIYGSGGILVYRAGQPLIENNIIRNNASNDQGGGIQVLGDASAPVPPGYNGASIIQNLIYGNTINPTLEPQGYAEVGAGVNLSPDAGSAPIEIVNNTIAGNQLLLVPGARSQGTQIYAEGHMERIYFTNNLIIGSGSQSAVDCHESLITHVAPPAFDHNDVFNLGGGTTAVYSGDCSNQTGTSGNISEDPLFAGDATAANPFELLLSSPAVDAGNNAAPELPGADFLDQPRIQNAKGLSTAIIDMGAYEYPGVPTTVPVNFALNVTPSTLAIKNGQSLTASVIVTPLSGALGPVTLTCVGLPAFTSCSFSPSSLNFTSAIDQASIVTISVNPSKAEANAGGAFKSLSIGFACILMFPAILPRRRAMGRNGKNLYRLSTLIAIFLFSLGAQGCGYTRIPYSATSQVTVQAVATNYAVTKTAVVTLMTSQ